MFRKLEDNRVQFLATAATLEEAEQLARAQQDCGTPCKHLEIDLFNQNFYGRGSMVVHSIRQGSEGMVSMSLQLSKMKYYFEDYGCLKCGKKTNVVYRSNGLCNGFTVVVRARTVLALKR